MLLQVLSQHSQHSTKNNHKPTLFPRHSKIILNSYRKWNANIVKKQCDCINRYCRINVVFNRVYIYFLVDCVVFGGWKVIHMMRLCYLDVWPIKLYNALATSLGSGVRLLGGCGLSSRKSSYRFKGIGDFCEGLWNESKNTRWTSMGVR